MAAKKPTNTGFGQRLRELREKKGLSQLEFAAISGIHVQSIAKMERSERDPQWSSVLILAKALGVKPNAFLTKPT